MRFICPVLLVAWPVLLAMSELALGPAFRLAGLTSPAVVVGRGRVGESGCGAGVGICEAGTPTQRRSHSLVRQCWAELGRKNRTFLSPDRGRTSINCTHAQLSSEPFLPRRIMHWRSDTITLLPLRVPWFWFPHFFPLYSVDGAEDRRGVIFHPERIRHCQSSNDAGHSSVPCRRYLH